MAEWQLTLARAAERQVQASFELHRLAIDAGLRFADAAASALDPNGAA